MLILTFHRHYRSLRRRRSLKRKKIPEHNTQTHLSTISASLRKSHSPYSYLPTVHYSPRSILQQLVDVICSVFAEITNRRVGESCSANFLMYRVERQEKKIFRKAREFLGKRIEGCSWVKFLRDSCNFYLFFYEKDELPEKTLLIRPSEWRVSRVVKSENIKKDCAREGRMYSKLPALFNFLTKTLDKEHYKHSSQLVSCLTSHQHHESRDQGGNKGVIGSAAIRFKSRRFRAIQNRCPSDLHSFWLVSQTFISDIMDLLREVRRCSSEAAETDRALLPA